ncbi:MAG TPA: 2-dehydro-3-deoxygalactonokinase [Casimicrobiaceae bacterium]
MAKPAATILDTTRLIAIDWGTTSARAYALDAAGEVLARRSATLGVQYVAGGDFAGALATLTEGLSGAAPMLACGMIGSRQGWVEVPYQGCPARFEAIATGVVAVPGTRLSIVPGLLHRDDAGIADVMRGEETQIVGTVLDDAPQLVVLPGTHCKWALVRKRTIVAFSTFMTGELFAVLREHSILGRLMTAGDDAGALARGVAWSLRENAALTHDLFSARTLPLTGALAQSAAADYLSGLLLGAEIVAARRWIAQHAAADAPVTLVGDAALCERYAVALRLANLDARIGATTASARGLWQIALHAGLVHS